MFIYFNKVLIFIFVYILLSSISYILLDKKIVDIIDDEILIEEWILDQFVVQIKIIVIVEVKGIVDVVFISLVVEVLDRYYFCLKIRLLFYIVMYLYDISKWNIEFINQLFLVEIEVDFKVVVYQLII